MKININNLKYDLKKVYEITGCLPTVMSYKKHGNYGLTTIKRHWGSWNKALIEVWNETNSVRHEMKKIICPTCKNKFKQKFLLQKYCSQRCAAITLNKIRPKRKKSMKKCNCCNNMIPVRDMYCSECRKIGKHLRGGILLGEKTIKEVMDKGANRYGVIRGHARQVVKSRLSICENCGYKKHVEVCHKKHISKYPITTKIKEINIPKNLVLLCSNCHWELDHGILKPNEIGGP